MIASKDDELDLFYYVRLVKIERHTCSIKTNINTYLQSRLRTIVCTDRDREMMVAEEL